MILDRIAAGLRMAAHLIDEAAHIVREIRREWNRDDLVDCARDVVLREEPPTWCGPEEAKRRREAARLCLADMRERGARHAIRPPPMRIAETGCAACNALDNVCDRCLGEIAAAHERGAA